MLTFFVLSLTLASVLLIKWLSYLTKRASNFFYQGYGWSYFLSLGLASSNVQKIGSFIHAQLSAPLLMKKEKVASEQGGKYNPQPHLWKRGYLVLLLQARIFYVVVLY